ncbi:MAG: YggT family protein [Actinomycetota bacterium]|nr:YggT family protein [Actinomycetota bacterium]
MPDILCLISSLLGLYTFVLFARIILSYITMFRAPSPAFAPLIRIIYDLTEPVLGFFRRFIPPLGMIDLSPLVVFLLISFLRSYLC